MASSEANASVWPSASGTGLALRAVTWVTKHAVQVFALTLCPVARVGEQVDHDADGEGNDAE
jgi:hypothetical protein